MSDQASQQPSEIPEIDITIEDLRGEIRRLEQALHESAEAARARLIQSQLRAAAAAAGMVDLDGLKLVDPARAKPNQHGELEAAAELMAGLKREKPWLFGGHSSSSRANVPPAQPPRAKLASEMTADEYRAARAELLRRR